MKLRLLVSLCAVAIAASCVTVESGGTSVPDPYAGMSPAQRELAQVEAAAEKLASGDAESAERELARMAEENPGKTEYKVLHASVLLSQGRIDEAIVELEAVIATEPGNIDAAYALAVAYKAKGNLRRARELLDAILAIDSANCLALALYGDIAYAAGETDKALAYYDRAIAANPMCSEALVGRGLALAKNSRYAAALEAFDLAVAANPGDSVALGYRAMVKRAMHDLAGAEADLSAALALDPDSWWLRFERARVYIALRDADRAIADLNVAVASDPEAFSPYLLRSSLLEEKGLYAEALSDYRKMAAIKPEYFYSFESIGVLSFILGDFPGSAEGFLGARKYAPERLDFAIMASIATWRSGDAKAAAKVAQDALKGLDRERYPLAYFTIRLLAEQNDMTFELEIKIGAEKRLDDKSSYLFYLSEYWDLKGKAELAEKYRAMVREMHRGATNEYRIVMARYPL